LAYISLIVPEFNGVSKSIKELITQMLTTPQKRIKSSQVIESKWLKGDIKKNISLPLNFGGLKSFSQNHQLKKLALTYIAS